MDDEALFLAAIDKAAGAERRAFLDEACGGDNALRRRVEQLFEADAQTRGILERGPEGTIAEHEPAGEQPGGRIGPYELLEPIGEGGMGVVYLAEQREPVSRRVALKVVKPGMDTRQVLARFEAERQALAMMDHPNIAKVHDAGTTAAGRPYFVMELVQGVPITVYCDEHHLTPHERLSLFLPVCRAIQHAHQKGIIHRDIKSSNILVTLVDGQPVPKVIDFGIAQAIDRRLTERTMFTEVGAIVGTPEYMSPEQAEMNAFGVDTRSDIYSLGVLLYELLTGTTPLEQRRLREAALDEKVRLIKEEEAPRPSVRLSSSNNLPKIAAVRNTDPGRLSGIVRGELDWIVMKCLEKDRTRRYESASGLARDIERYLADEPVEACPPSVSYRLRKFARGTNALWSPRWPSHCPCSWVLGSPFGKPSPRPCARCGRKSHSTRQGRGSGNPRGLAVRPGTHSRRGPAEGAARRDGAGGFAPGGAPGGVAVRGNELQTPAADRGRSAPDFRYLVPGSWRSGRGDRTVRSGPRDLHTAARS